MMAKIIDRSKYGGVLDKSSIFNRRNIVFTRQLTFKKNMQSRTSKNLDWLICYFPIYSKLPKYTYTLTHLYKIIFFIFPQKNT